MRVRRAATSDIPTIARWRQETAAWLATTGSDQWSDAGLTDAAFRARVTTSVAAGETWMADDNGTAIGTIAIDTHADPGLWTPEALAISLVVHRMIVPRAFAGRQVGAALLNHADRLASDQAKRWLILDAWDSNRRLHEYYQAQGFRYIRTQPNHSTPSATLFARPLATVDADQLHHDMQQLHVDPATQSAK